jgi:hypothetical protein
MSYITENPSALQGSACCIDTKKSAWITPSLLESYFASEEVPKLPECTECCGQSQKNLQYKGESHTSALSIISSGEVKIINSEVLQDRSPA